MRGLNLIAIRNAGQQYLHGDFGDKSRSEWRKEVNEAILRQLDKNYAFGHLYPEDVGINWHKDDCCPQIVATYLNGKELVIRIRPDMAVIDGLYVSYGDE